MVRSEAAAGLDRQRILALERVEILAKLDGVEGAPKARQELRLLLRRVGGAWAFGRPRDPSLSINRFMGFGLEATLAAAGFGTYLHWIKWVRDGSPAKTAATELRIERAGPGEAEAMDELLLAAFVGRPYSVPYVSALIGRPYWHHYVARDGGNLIASASMYAREGFAWLGAAGTLASHRGRGAKAA